MGDPLIWVELFAAANIAFLAVDIGLAHAVNAFEHRRSGSRSPSPWSPRWSCGGDVARRAWRGGGQDESRPVRGLAARLPGMGLAVGWGSVAVGVAGLLWHLDSQFFEEQTLKNLVYTAPVRRAAVVHRGSASC